MRPEGESMSQSAALAGILGFAAGWCIIGTILIWRHALRPFWKWIRETWPDKPNKQWKQGAGPSHP